MSERNSIKIKVVALSILVGVMWYDIHTPRISQLPQKVSVEMFHDTATGQMKVLMTNNEQHALVSPRYVCQVTDRFKVR